jgi:GntR family transcriptional repressor for pyruvate dehydrogenase complex
MTLLVARPPDDSAAQVVAHVRELIDRGALGPGARLPPERDLAAQVGVSRPTVRAGLRTLAALGVVRSRRGSGTYIPDGPPTLGAEALSFLAALHKFTVDDMYEARRILEVGAAGLAAERATPDQLASLADEVASLFASLHDRQVFLVHDINFHRVIAASSGNPIVASLVEMVASLYYERRRATAARAADRDLRDAADAHRQIYQAVRARNAEVARRAMTDHLLRSRSYQAREAAAQTETPTPRSRRKVAR